MRQLLLQLCQALGIKEVENMLLIVKLLGVLIEIAIADLGS